MSSSPASVIKQALTFGLVAIVLVGAHGASGAGFRETFDDGPGLVALENFRSFDDGTPALGWGATLGTSGSGGLLLNRGGNGNSFHRGAGGDDRGFYSLADLPGGAKLVTSVDFRGGGGTTGLTVLTFGLTADNALSALTQRSGINVAGSLIRSEESEFFRLRMRVDSEDADVLEFSPDAFADGSWYRLILTLKKSTSLNEVDYELAVESIGPDGTLSPTRLNVDGTDVVLTGTVGDSSAMESTELLWAIDGRNASDGLGIEAVDNLTLTISP